MNAKATRWLGLVALTGAASNAFAQMSATSQDRNAYAMARVITTPPAKAVDVTDDRSSSAVDMSPYFTDLAASWITDRARGFGFARQSSAITDSSLLATGRVEARAGLSNFFSRGIGHGDTEFFVRFDVLTANFYEASSMFTVADTGVQNGVSLTWAGLTELRPTGGSALFSHSTSAAPGLQVFFLEPGSYEFSMTLAADAENTGRFGFTESISVDYSARLLLIPAPGAACALGLAGCALGRRRRR